MPPLGVGRGTADGNGGRSTLGGRASQQGGRGGRSDRKESGPARRTTMQPGGQPRARILCLHGGHQTGELLRQRLERLHQRCKADGIHLDFADAPTLLPDGTRRWYDGADAAAAVHAAARLWADGAPFDGLLGFSQGAAVVSAAVMASGLFPGLRFAILAGAPDEPVSVACSETSTVPSLHIMSAQDELVPLQASQRVAKRFLQSEVYTHNKGHAMPCRAPDIDQYLEFIGRHVAGAGGGGARPAVTVGAVGAEPREAEQVAEEEQRPSEPAASSSQLPDDASQLPDLASLQIADGANGAELLDLLHDRAAQLAAWGEELQAVEAIFGGDLVFDDESLDCASLQEAADSAAEAAANADPDVRATQPPPTVFFSVRLGDAATPEEDLPPGELRLEVRLGVSYPHAGASALGLSLYHRMLAHQFPPDGGAAVLAAARRAAAEALDASPGESVAIWSAVSGANEALADGRWRGGGWAAAAAVAAEPDGGAAAAGEDAERKEAALAALLDQLSDEAQARAAATDPAVLLGAVQSEGATAEGRQTSLRGAWHFSIGLVGKPSAGKSTFFNALTRAGTLLGVTAAKTGAQPFTTIEPNVGPAVWAAPPGSEPEELVAQRTPTAHGRAASGARLLPCTLVDIAGLVPGAYLGRGKGNLFLQELTRVDVLIHVVDGSGTTDKGGNLQEAPEQLLASGGGGGDVIAEIGWVRAEIHLWVYTNVAHKRPVWRKRPRRLAEMFIGYGGSPALVAGVLKRARQAAVSAGGEDTGSADDEFLARVCGGSAAGDLRGMSLDDPADVELHRLVASYVATRWPVAVALNKMDVPSAAMHERVVRERYPDRVIVPVSARAEEALLRAQAGGECEYALGATPGGVRSSAAAGAADSLASALAVLDSWGSTGTLEVISRAVALRAPTLGFPCSCTASLAPLGREEGAPLFDCLLLKPLTTVGDLYECCKREMLCAGDFVRAEARRVDGPAAGAVVVRRDDVVAVKGAIVRVQTRRASWQNKEEEGEQHEGGLAKPEKISGRRRQAG